MVKDYKKLNKEREIRKCYKCNKVRHLAKNYRLGQKNRSIEKELEDENKENNSKKAGFVEGFSMKI